MSHTVSSKMQPSVMVTISDAEYELWLELGIVYDGAPVPVTTSYLDTQVAELVDRVGSATRAELRALMGADAGGLNDGVIAALVPGPSSTATALRAAFGALPKVAATVTASGALVVNKHNPVDASGGVKTMTLPTGQAEGTQVSIEKTDASANAVAVTGSVRGVGSSTISLVWQNEDVLFRADSAGSWWPIAGHKTKNSLDAAYGRPAKFGAGFARRISQELGTQVMPTPPTLTASGFSGSNFCSAGLSAVSGQIGTFGTYAPTAFIPTNAGVYGVPTVRAMGTKPVSGTQSFQTTMLSQMNNTQSVSPGPWRASFRHFGYRIAVFFASGGQAQARFKIDGQYVSKTPYQLGVGSGVNAVTFDFSSTLTITGVTTANPGVITTSTPHGRTTGDRVTISGVGGATQANVTAVVTVLTPTTFSIPVNVTGTYTSGGTVTVGATARTFEIEMTGNCGIYRLQFDTTDSVVAAEPVPGPRVLIVGDSYIDGAGSAYPGFSGLAQTVFERLGCVEAFVDSAGGTGYVATNAPSPNYLTRQQYNWPNVVQAAGGVDLAVIFGSINDPASSTQAQLQAQAQALYSLYGNVPVVAVIAANLTPPNAVTLANLASLQAAAAACPNVLGVLDLTKDLSGSGSSSTAATDGNAAVFRYSDGAHPTQGGHDWYGVRIASYIRGLFV